MKPKDGKVWLIADVLLENTNDDEFNSSTLLSYEAKDGEGRKLDISIFADTEDSLDVTVGANDKAIGEIAFEVGKKGDVFLTFKPSLLDKKTVKLKLR